MVVYPGIRPEAMLQRAYPLIQGLNVLGAAFGLVWYWPQLHETHLLLLPFVPDCPLAAALLALALWRWRSGTGEALQGAAIGIAMFYGAWTVAVLWRGGALSDLGDRVMLLAHLGMMLEALLLWQVARPRRGWRLAALWVAVNTFVDYTLGTHPALPAALASHAVALATAAAAIAFVLLAPNLDPSP